MSLSPKLCCAADTKDSAAQLRQAMQTLLVCMALVISIMRAAQHLLQAALFNTHLTA